MAESQRSAGIARSLFPPDPGPGAKIGGMVRMTHATRLYVEG